MSGQVSLVTVQCSGPRERFTLTDHTGRLVVHLAGGTATGGTGPCICGYDRFLGGFSIGGGVSGPGVKQDACQDCARLADGADIHGIHAHLFRQETTR